MSTRYAMEFILSHWWLFDREWRKNHPDTFEERRKCARVATVRGCWSLDENGDKIYEEEWSTI